MSAWRKVFLRNGLVWTPYLLAWLLLAGEFSGNLGALLYLVPIWVALIGGGMCLFRRIVQWMTSEAAQRGKELPSKRWRWFWSYFLEIDEGYRLRP
jgi:hypothetical protein